MASLRQRVGRPSKYKHGRALSGAERVRAMRAKQILATTPITSLKYKKAKLQLEELYSEGVNPNKARTELKDRFGHRVDIHGFEELKQDRY
ncbi:46127_t:CDS:2 [Gigaspora margarita]|uniref:46127_t:CDS:1 n=1 Tax=Gigaspora margarita TaxID=4874 RepID=A0ABN7UUN0_GIGMA|nr:46127_t:CDS:2 [Gigaspora margarita]